MPTQHSNVQVRAISADDRDDWEVLYRGYREFYQMPHHQSVYASVWDWLMDPDHEEQGLIAQLGDEAAGIAHFRRFPRPLVGSHGLYLDDLFTDPASRGAGVATALLTRLSELAHADGASVVRWITASENTVAQHLYDQTAQRTQWVTYDLKPSPEQ